MDVDTKQEKKNMFLKPETILRYLITEDEELDTLIMCHNNQFDFSVTDQGLYEALGSIKEYDTWNQKKLIKLLEVTKVLSFKRITGKERYILTDEKLEDMRAKALKGD